ncbi:MAG: 2-amino-4-hydroxy-6-hydroxymethyldihydropteridine diphosphokinase [Prevotella sp.]|jgi:2-amino-4-hydroxy-6-hydroxymethyldihydropteridine diphosphokinase|nr:2-amino-4-hydroxy-6-hydroxymethyldihydropteridine diphosphokinase [Prevotella sp.]MCH4183181.1 2-amino-4-hydroxy-6-hydroxymethyldihydropteridine diphosphokinase [Prevotella sp.]MCH4212864.1 2-amino-4-hydroxy-6-hydroxymethyldihydropteridine diphosphokinase [Prevotella sp.]MCH4241944.1 2-amino-4-hydroxy-6-hydroxymethyldihydropteridine diphosphokinase [Prevotella sp.]
MHQIYIALGSNLGNRKKNIDEAITRIGERVGTVDRCSSLIETKPWGFRSSHDFMNCCIGVRTQLTPRGVLDTTQYIERELGRHEKSKNGIYHDRVIDIDILLYDHVKVDEPDLKIPHPLMLERDFVMKPLKEILSVDRK